MSLKCVKEDGRIGRLNHVAPVVSCKPPKSEFVRVSTTSLRQGTAVTLGEWTERPLSERDKGLKWYDFTIDSLNESGLISELRYMQMNEGSIAAADALDAVDVPQVDVNNNVNENTVVE